MSQNLTARMLDAVRTVAEIRSERYWSLAFLRTGSVSTANAEARSVYDSAVRMGIATTARTLATRREYNDR